ncbi:hypothetical protein FOA52_001305 [Chlamydomonas sp. UWO 241]|nr:hypothetical protein FOA52_001305 [Chlamydomonas sp. UWO 241]
MQGDNLRDWQDMPECGTPWPGSIFSFPQGNSTWEPEWDIAKPNVCLFAQSGQEDLESMGPEMAFAKALIAGNASQRVGFVPVTWGGSSLFGEWSDSRRGLLATLLNQVHLAMAQAGPHAALRGMVWVQGEGDATIVAGRTHAAMYGVHMERLIGTVRAELSAYHPQLPFIMAVQSTTGRDRVLPFIDLVRRHQLALEMPGLLKVDMEGLEMLADDFTEMYGSDVGVQRLHVTKRAMCTFGDAMAGVYLAARKQLEQAHEWSSVS